MSNELHALLARVESHDPATAKDLREHIDALMRRRSFGLNFERHMPEFVALNGRQIAVGDKVRFKPARGEAEADSEATWVVTTLAGSQGAERAELLNPRTKERSSRPLADLTYVADFRDPIYPGLVSTGKVEHSEGDPYHTIINAENFHAMKAMLFAYRARFDVIYIDPPYNTGGKASWLYNDDYIDGEDHFKHSKWLAFMERRLKLARRLLSDSGVIFVSIDDAEQHRLRMLLDQVFGESNFVDTLAVEMTTTSGPKTVNAQQGTIVKNVEFVHIYRKSASFDRVKHTPLFDGVEQFDTHYTRWIQEDGTLGQLIERMMSDASIRAEIEKTGLLVGGKFSVKRIDQLLAVSDAAREFIQANLDRIARVDRPPVSAKDQAPPVDSCVEFQASGRTYLLTTLPSGTLQQVMPLSLNYRLSDDYKPRYGRTVIRGDLWKGFHQDMGNVAKEGGVAFSNGKKPVRLIKQLIRWANNSPDALVLDFFGGSGTTAHAVMMMNVEDNGRRRAVLVTNNELNEQTATRLRRQGIRPGDTEWESQGVCEAVTKPRLTNAAESAACPANIEFFELTYENPALVELDLAFERIAPLLWIQAGAEGRRIDSRTNSFDITETYAVLFNIDASREFLAASLKASWIRVAFIVTDDEAQYQAVASQLPEGIDSVRLYESYLRTFAIDTGSS